MTDYVGDPQDNQFEISGDGNSNVDGGAGYDILTIDYSGMDSPQADVENGVIYAYPLIPAGPGFTWDFDNPLVTRFTNIEKLILNLSTGMAISVAPTDIETVIMGGFGGRLTLNLAGTVQGVTLDLSSDEDVKTVGTLSFSGFSTFGFVGGAGNDVVTGGTAMDFLNGGGGDDILDGGGGWDFLSGAQGNDIYILRESTYSPDVSEEADSGIDEVRTYRYQQYLSDNVENLVGLSVDGHDLHGNDLGNRITGGAGGDTIWGGDGNDVIEGGLGSDQLHGESGMDTLSYERAGAAVTVSLAAGTGQFALAGSGSDSVDGFENIRGSAYDDVLTGDNGANILSGLDGADRMTGLGGDDQYWVDSKADRVIEAAGGGYDQVFANVDYVLADQVEALTLIGRTNIDATGNALDNILTGNSGNNRLVGGSGQDVMIGGAGDDIYHVNSGGDRVIEVAGGGTDLIVSSISIDLTGMAVENVRLVGSRKLDLTGNDLANMLSGNAGDNILRGYDGHDVLTGGAGRDIFGFDLPPGVGNVDRITDFSVADDSIHLRQSGFGAISKGILDADAFHLGSVAGDAQDRILYDGASGAIFYDADGSGAGAAVLFAQVTPGLTLTYADFTIV